MENRPEAGNQFDSGEKYTVRESLVLPIPLRRRLLIMRKRIVTFLSLAMMCLITAGSFAETVLPYGQSQLDGILASYA